MKQLSGGTLEGVDGRDLGESKLRRRSRPMAEIGCSFSFGELEDLKSLQKLMWRFSASSTVMRLSDLMTSSFTASTQSPHIHLPWYFSRTRDMYSSVHSSVNSHDSHFTNSTSVDGTATFRRGGWDSDSETSVSAMINASSFRSSYLEPNTVPFLSLRIDEDDGRASCGVSCWCHTKNVCITHGETAAPTHCTPRMSRSFLLYPTRVDLSPSCTEAFFGFHIILCITDCGLSHAVTRAKITYHWHSEVASGQRLGFWLSPYSMWQTNW